MTKQNIITQATGKFGPNGEGGWYATRWSFDGIKGEGTGLTEGEALKAADAHIEEQRQDRTECEGHPAGPYDPPGESVYCDGSCRCHLAA